MAAATTTQMGTEPAGTVDVDGDTNFLPRSVAEIPSSPTESTQAVREDGTSSSTVDSALQAALREPRERVALLRLETALMDFMQNNDAYWLEVGGPYNSILIGPSRGNTNSIANGGSNSSLMMGRQTSFQRCILHRLADRFGIVRENGVVLEGSIRLIKLPDSKVPAKLLQDLEPSEYAAVPPMNNYGLQGVTLAMSQASLDSSSNVTGSASNGPASSFLPTSNPQQQQQRTSRKMKIMKRSDRSRSSTPSHGANADKKSSLKKSTSVLSDKEKAYAEARARIFSDESSESNNNTTSSSLAEDTGISAPAVAFAATAALQSPVRASASSERNNFGGSAKDTSNGTTTATTNSSSLNSENKAVYRNRLEEAADPDFQRGGLVVYRPAFYTSAVAASSINNGTTISTATNAPVLSPYAATAAATAYHHPLHNHYYPSPPLSHANASPAGAAGPSTISSAMDPRANVVSSTSSNSNSNILAADAPAFYPSWAQATTATARSSSQRTSAFQR